MSNQYPGGIITKNPATPTGPFETGAAPGIWTLTQQAGYKQQGVWPTAGLSANYIEEVFSCFLYTGTGASQTITNNIDLSTKGGLTWIKGRSGATNHALYDTARGATFDIASNLSTAQTTQATGLTAFGTTGFSIGALAKLNTNAATYASWTFRKQPKFFDVVTFTKSTANLSVPHNLGSIPGCVIIKATNINDAWYTYHRNLTSTNYNLYLNNTSGQADNGASWISLTSTTVDLNTGLIPADGNTYVMYVFAHDAGGFGLTGTDNVISCGSYTGNGSTTGPVITLGYEPQWLMVKKSSGLGDWVMVDNMRGIVTDGVDPRVWANLNSAENTGDFLFKLNATGFQPESLSDSINASGLTYIYIAIRRGQMKVPTLGTSVFAPVTGNFTSPYTVTTNFPVDLTISSRTAGATRAVNDRLRGGTTNSYAYLNTRVTDAELTGTGAGLGFQNNTAVIDTNWQTGGDAIWWNWRRAPSFFDEVCYTGNGTGGRTVSHNLTVAPEMIIAKNRSGPANPWLVFTQPTGNSGVLVLNATDALVTPYFNWTPTSTTFSVGAQGFASNDSGVTYVAFLFATCAGVSKVGSYTGTGATQTINCGFGAGGARFALIKRTDSTGDWWVWDSARGMVSGTDPRIDLNAGNSQTNANWVYTISTGFQIVTTDASVNASGGTYIFLAIA